MTSNQIEYWKLSENSRHNLATETQARSELAETRRHNLQGETLTGRDIREKIRHNTASESLSRSDLREKARHNLRAEELTDFSNQSGRITAIAQQQNAASQALQAQAAQDRNDITRLANANALRAQGYSVNEDGTFDNSPMGIINNSFFTALGALTGGRGAMTALQYLH